MENNFKSKFTFKRKGLILKSTMYWHTKDPCPVFDGSTWHIFGSGGKTGDEVWHILHATAPNPEGPWTEQEAPLLDVVEGPHVAAPGVIYDPNKQLFHMFVQREFMQLGGTIEHLVSVDGKKFQFSDTALESIPGTTEAGIYDPHPAMIDGKMYLIYSAMDRISHPDLFLAESEGSWRGPWKRHGRILGHENIPHHNQHTQENYEWGLEGSQLIPLPSGNILLNAVCFLPEGRRGERQRVFFAAARMPSGPFHTLGTVIDPIENQSGETTEEHWESGDNGHAAGIIHGDSLYLFYQSRAFSPRNRWCYGLAEFEVAAVEKMVAEVLKNNN
jgi:hypothetical protein